MTEIPGWAYAMIGAVVSGFSRFVEVKSGQKMALFFYIGLFFILIGLFKMAKSAIFKNKKQATPQANQRNHGNMSRQTPQIQNRQQPLQTGMHHTHQQRRQGFSPVRQQGHNQDATQQNMHPGNARHIQPILSGKSPATAQHPSIISCPACGVSHYAYAKFCMMCGSKIK